MGWTGQAGHRHLHFSINKIPGESNWIERISWDGESVPFNFMAIKDGVKQLVNSSELKCPHANIDKVETKLQPRLKGTF